MSRSEKVSAIEQAIEDYSNTSSKSVKSSLIKKLRKYSISKYGLVSKELRAKVWPLILSIDTTKLPPKPTRLKVRKNKWFNQVKLDVDRCISRLPKNLPSDQTTVLQDNLIDLILHIMEAHPELNYYQGYHDITITILQVCGLRLAVPVAEKLTMSNLKDFMQETMDSTKLVLNLIFPIISVADPELYYFLQMSEVGSYFALSWLITWYGHVMKDLKRTSRIYDFFMASHPIMPIYLATEILLHRRDEILSTDCDMPSVHHVLTSLASQNYNDDDLIKNAITVFFENPPSKIIGDSQNMSYFQLYIAKISESSFDCIIKELKHTEDNFTLKRRNGLLRNSEFGKNHPHLLNENRKSIVKRISTFTVLSAIVIAGISYWIQNLNI